MKIQKKALRRVDGAGKYDHTRSIFISSIGILQDKKILSMCLFANHDRS